MGMSKEDWLGTAVAPGLYWGGKSLGLFGKKSISEPQEVKDARSKLANFMNTGTFGDFTAGAEVPLGYGDFSATNAEKQGLSSLQDLLTSGIPDQYRMGDQALADLMDTSAAGIDRMYQPFKDLATRETANATRDAKRSAAFAGNLYSTDTIGKLGDVQARGNETMLAKLAELTNSALNRKLSAVPLAYQSAQGQEALKMGRIAASQEYGSLTRRLNDASIKARDAELLRRRQELQLPIQAASNIIGTNWTPTVETSPYADLLGLVGTIGGAYFGGPMGAYAGGQAGRTLGGGGSYRPVASNRDYSYANA